MKRIVTVAAFTLAIIFSGIAENLTWDGIMPSVSMTPLAASAQSVTFQDNCVQYQHLTVALAANATPTAKLVSGQAGRTIYVCAMHLSQNVAGATPLITFYSGTGTTCLTGNVNEGSFSAGAAGTNANVIDANGGSVIVGVTGGDLCTVGNTASIPQGSIEYVLK